MRVVVVTPPAEEPVTLAEAKLHLRVDHAEDDALIAALIVSARQVCELRLDRAIVTQTLDAFLDRWPCGSAWWDRGRIALPRPPLQSVASVTYTDTAGAAQTWPPADYQVVTGTQGLVLPAYGKSWPSARNQAEAIRVQFVAGYGAASAVPACINQAILMLIAHWYDVRSPVTVGMISKEVELTVEALLDPERWGNYS